MLRALLLFVLTSSTLAADEPVAVTPDQARLLGVATAPVTAAAALIHDGLIGEVQLPLAGSAAVATPYAGRVLAIDVDEGDRVSIGQRLALLASREYADDRARLVRGESDLELARQQATRDEALLAAGIIPAARVEASRAARRSAEAELAALRATVGQLPAASAGAASFALNAPLAGRVVARHIEPGAALDSLAVAFVIATEDAWRLEVGVPLKLAARIGPGASLRVGAIEAAIAGRGMQIDTATQTVHVRAVLPAGSGLLPGQRVSASLVLPAPAQALGVPRAALSRVAEQAHVFVQREAGYVWLPVTVLGESGTQSVVSGELMVGEAVVTSGVSALKALLED